MWEEFLKPFMTNFETGMRGIMRIIDSEFELQPEHHFGGSSLKV